MGSFAPLMRRAAASLLVSAAAAALAGCGTPATVKPAASPVSGLSRDIQAAQNVSDQARQQAQQYDATGATLP